MLPRNRDQYKGIWVKTLTPFDYEGDILKNTLLKHYEFLQEGGISGIIPLTPIGEAPSLTFDEKVLILRKYGEKAMGMRIIPAIFENSLNDAKYFVKVAISAGVDGILVYPPHFYSYIKQKKIYQYYKELFKETQKYEPKIPIFIAINDPYSKIPLSDLFLEKLARKFENIYGVLDYEATFNSIKQFQEKFPNLVYFSVNEEEHLNLLQNGVEGIVSIIGNAFPHLVSTLYRLIKKKQSEENMEQAILFQQQIKMIQETLQNYPIHSALKYALYQQQFPAMNVRLPLDSLKESQKTVLKDGIKGILGRISAFQAKNSCE